jgi:hypothetical protein
MPLANRPYRKEAPVAEPKRSASAHSIGHERLLNEKLSVGVLTVTNMDTTTAQTLRVVRSDEDPAPAPPSTGTQEEYWAQVQALRADLARLRPAN